MNGTQTTLYFSRRHDADLISLYNQIGRKAFVKIMKDALRTLVRVDYEPIFTKSTEILPVLLDGSDKYSDNTKSADEEEKKPFFVVVSFSAEKDKDIANLLLQVKPRKMGTFVKNAMRLLLGPYYTLGCLLDGDARLNDAFKDRKLFFVNGCIGEGSTKSSKPSKSSKPAKKKQQKIDEKIEEMESVSKENAPICEEVASEETFVPIIPEMNPTTDGEAESFSDDDILSLLENM